MYVVTVDVDLCTGCGECVNTCPAQIFRIENDKSVVNDDECLGCQSCVAICPVGAIKVEEF
jgi:NAD-dependent dihydropyrimidine dehydrogenase PreA subunit